MASELRLESGQRELLPARLTQIFGLAAKLAPSAPLVVMHGQELRAARALAVDDDACAGFVLDFAGQGARVVVTAQGPSAALLRWAFHMVAQATKCTLREDGAEVTPAPDEHRAAAFAYVDAYEADVAKSRAGDFDFDGDAFVAWLAREGLVEVEEDSAGDFAELPMDDVERLYEILLDHPSVVEVFVSERELGRLHHRFLARARR